MKLHRTVFTTVLAAFALTITPPTTVAQDGWTSLLTPQLEKYHQPEVNAVHFFTRHIGWAVGGHARDRTGRNQETFIFKTGDGGESWERLTLFDGQDHVPDFSVVGFADANNGWIAGHQHLLRTTDGGESWVPIDIEDPVYFRPNALLTLGPDVAMFGLNSTNGRQIRVTTDGGQTWRVSTVTSGGRDNVADLAFVAPGSFFAVIAGGMQNRGGIYRSDDGGRSWTAVVEGKEPLHTVAFSPGGRNGVAAGDDVAYSTTDGGNTWRRVPAAGARYAAEFLDEDNVIAFGHDPAMLISGDGGRTWRPGSGPELGYSFLVDVQVVDPGWWLVAGGRGAYDLFRYEDPDYRDPIARGTLPLPDAVTAPDGTVLPPGRYDVQLLHLGLDHALGLHLLEPAGGVQTGVEGELGPDQYACDPCEAAFRVDADYDLQELAQGQDAGSLFKLSLEPTATGVAVVVNAAVNPPRDLAVALAALGAPTGADVDARETAQQAKSGGGLFGRIKRAASGDIRGALEGAANPEAAAQRVRAARAAPPAVYQVRVRYPLELFGAGSGTGPETP